jgi:hypothetical protein
MAGDTQRLATAGRKGTRRSRRTRQHGSHGDRKRDYAQEPTTHRFLLWRGDIAAQILTATALHGKPPQAVRMLVPQKRRGTRRVNHHQPYDAGDQESAGRR